MTHPRLHPPTVKRRERSITVGKNPLHTKLCDSLGIECPIVAFTRCKDVAAAVINANVE
jgi:hypothetical protein